MSQSAKPLEIQLPLVWKKIEDSLHHGHLTEDIFFRVEKDGRSWFLYAPYDVLKKNPLTAKDTDQAVDAANNIAIEHFHKIIKAHIATLKQDLFAPDGAANKAAYEELLKLTREDLIKIFLSVGREKP